MLTSYYSLNPLFLLEGLNFVPNFQKNGGVGGDWKDANFCRGGWWEKGVRITDFTLKVK